MRLTRLDLLRYGHLADVTLAFPREASLHVVLGANEAGKSTALAAIGDALFGFPHSTRFDYRFPTAQLRLGFEVEAADGVRSAFIRRKGNKNTLLDPAENPVPDAALARFLGAASRELFSTTFGLDGAALRDGALSLLESGGEAGEGLLAAMGLPHLRRALERLDEEAKALHGDGRGRRRLALTTEAWREATNAAEAAAIRPREWQDSVEQEARITAALTAATQEAGALAAERSRLERVRRVLPLLRQMDKARAELAERADAPALPPDAAATLRHLAEALREAEADAGRETAEAERLDARRAALAQDPAILAAQDALDALAGRGATAAQAARDLPGVQQQVLAQRAVVAEAAADLGLADPPDAVREAVPKQADRQKAQRLIRRRTELATELATAERALREASRQGERAQAALTAAPEPHPAAPLRRAVEAARAEGPLDRELAAAGRALDKASQSLATALLALPLWSGDAAALAACPVPLPAATEAAALRLAQSREAAEAARRDSATLAAEIAALEEALARLAAGATVPTPEAIAAERGRRDAAWRVIRRAVEAGAAIPVDDPDRFEALRDSADRLADARAEDAQRVGDYADKSARLALLRDRRAGDAAALAAAEADAAQADAAWTALWAPCGIAPQRPEAMAQWRARRADILGLAGQEAEARDRRDLLAARKAAVEAALHAALPGTAPAATLTALLAQVAEACAAAETAEAAHRRLVETAERTAAQAEAAAAQRDKAGADLEAFEAEWRPAAALLGLAPESTAEDLEAALGAWTRIAEAARAWRGDAARVEAMQAEIAAFARDVASLLAGLGENPAEPAAPALARLLRRLAEARAAERDATGMATRLVERRAAAEAAQRRHAEATAGLATLQEAAGAADVPALEAAIESATRRASLRAELDRLEAALLSQGAGHDEAALRAEAEGIENDQAAGRVAEIEAGQATRDAALTKLGAEQRDAASRLAALRAGRDAAAHAQDAQHHLAEARDAAERHARLHLARSLLQAAIERLRQEHQGPLLRAAGAHLALLTAGRHARLIADQDEAGRAVLRAVRDDGTECPVEALSEGTRDQLYLALRIAAVEAHAEAAEPLPFIADDLLMTFDDTRAAAAIALLARLGQRVQPILFTHHAHVAALARAQPGVHVQELPAA